MDHGWDTFSRNGHRAVEPATALISEELEFWLSSVVAGLADDVKRILPDSPSFPGFLSVLQISGLLHWKICRSSPAAFAAVAGEKKTLAFNPSAPRHFQRFATRRLALGIAVAFPIAVIQQTNCTGIASLNPEGTCHEPQ
jgi:hypothetical protein